MIIININSKRIYIKQFIRERNKMLKLPERQATLTALFSEQLGEKGERGETGGERVV